MPSPSRTSFSRLRGDSFIEGQVAHRAAAEGKGTVSVAFEAILLLRGSVGRQRHDVLHLLVSVAFEAILLLRVDAGRPPFRQRARGAVSVAFEAILLLRAKPVICSLSCSDCVSVAFEAILLLRDNPTTGTWDPPGTFQSPSRRFFY